VAHQPLETGTVACERIDLARQAFDPLIQRTPSSNPLMLSDALKTKDPAYKLCSSIIWMPLRQSFNHRKDTTMKSTHKLKPHHRRAR
jgi:hypothetical protein